MATIYLSRDGVFEADTLEEAKEKYLNYHFDRRIDAMAIKSIEDEDQVLDSAEVADIFMELEEEIEDFLKDCRDEEEGFDGIKAEVEGMIYG